MYATESCFGIGCDPSNIKAIKKIIRLKKRNNKKNFILISASIDNASNYIKQLNKVDLKEINKKWPGPHTPDTEVDLEMCSYNTKFLACTVQPQKRDSKRSDRSSCQNI